MVKKSLRSISYGLAALALAASAGLLAGDANLWAPPARAAEAFSAAPLLLVGASFLFVQPLIRPRWAELLKNLLLAATFLLWGVIQLLPQNSTTKHLGNLVIALYVLDLAWMTLAVASSRDRNEAADPGGTGQK